MSRILVTGGTGYIGSHTAADLIEKGYEVIIVDDLSRSSDTVLDAIFKITNVRPRFYKVNICDYEALEQVFLTEKNIDGIIHFAAYKYVNESVSNPLMYYRNNIDGLLNVLELTKKYHVPNFVFSSSCSVYGDIDSLPVTEKTALNPTLSPYATTKLIGEKMLDEVKLEIKSKFISLRYFNPVGAHMSGYMGESPSVVPSNIVPRITGTAIGKFDQLNIFGHTLPTRDGSCIRDYIHVEDIAAAHTAAMRYLETEAKLNTHEIFNLGTGEGVSVFELIEAFEKATGIELIKELQEQREGDVVSIYSDSTKANTTLKWFPKRSIEDMVLSAWNWEKVNS